ISTGEDRKGKYVCLDKTAFFPEGGGQSSDIGLISGIEVYDVQNEGEEIRHYLKGTLGLGSTAECEINWERRFRNMQNHSGEHIISGLIFSNFGFDNVGFHLGENDVTLDINGYLTRNDLIKIEKLANGAVIKNVEFLTYYPEKEKLSEINYRSKLDLEDNVRIVEIPGYDICACCAPHVKTSAEIGIIKILDFYKMRSGIRIHIKCGYDALDDYNRKYESVSKISNLLCSKQDEAALAVERLFKENSQLKYNIGQLKREQIIRKAEEFKAVCEKSAVFENELSKDELQLFADRLYKTYGGLRAVFSKTDEGYAFALCSDESYAEEFFKVMKDKLKVKGGGRNGMMQGTVLNSKEEILKVF
ncbi:MAG: hypothetical protein II802_02690, partial [Clostridia bacterium]|nr:hypothetical protein [Clostridia bacterium]